MCVLLKYERLPAAEPAVKAGAVPPAIAALSNKLTATRARLNKAGGGWGVISKS